MYVLNVKTDKVNVTNLRGFELCCLGSLVYMFDGVVFLCFTLELFWRCGIFVFHFRTVLTVWYFCVSL